VVKPIWLLMMKWIEPPVRWPFRPERPRHSATDALAREGRVAVEQQRHHGRAVVGRAAVLVLLGAHLAEHHGIDDLECDGLAVSDRWTLLPSKVRSDEGAEMVLHVARALHVVGRERAALELVEEGAVRLAHHLRQHVEAAAMGHAEHDLLHAEVAAALDDLLQRRDQRLAAIEAEALGARVLEVEELLEALRLDELVEDRALALAGEGDLLVRPLDALLEPGLLLGVGDVHELDAKGLAVGPLEDRDDLANGAELETRAPCRDRSCGPSRLP
jgi:hypothetical protein